MALQVYITYSLMWIATNLPPHERVYLPDLSICLARLSEVLALHRPPIFARIRKAAATDSSALVLASSSHIVATRILDLAQSGFMQSFASSLQLSLSLSCSKYHSRWQVWPLAKQMLRIAGPVGVSTTSVDQPTMCQMLATKAVISEDEALQQMELAQKAAGGLSDERRITVDEIKACAARWCSTTDLAL